MPGGRWFLDTNILVYTFDDADLAKRDRARDLVARSIQTGRGVISSQVVQEFLNVALRKFSTPLRPQDAEVYLAQVLEPLCEVFPSIGLYRSALALGERWNYGFYDSLILAGALHARCSVLYTEDLQDGQTVEGLSIRNPFGGEA